MLQRWPNYLTFKLLTEKTVSVWQSHIFVGVSPRLPEVGALPRGAEPETLLNPAVNALAGRCS